MDTANNDSPGLFDLEQQTLQEVYVIEKRKVRNKIFAAAAVIFLFDMIALAASNMFWPEMIAVTAVVPLLLVGLAFLSMKEPMLAVILSVLLLLGVITLVAIQSGPGSITQGLLGKAIMVSLLLAAFQSAKEAKKVKSQLL